MQQGMDAIPWLSGTLYTVVMILLVAWSFIWKGIALWKAARRDRIWWYIVMLVINTAGLLPIIYIFAVAPNQPEIDEIAPSTPTPPQA